MKTIYEYRAADYERYRPSYPDTLYDFLIAECNLEPDQTIVDVGAGTGKGSTPLAERGFRIVAVDAGENMLRANPGDKTIGQVCARANRLPLAASLGDLVLCAQSFHWFGTQETLDELRRIVKGSGRVALFWNCARPDSAGHQAYERLIAKYNPEYLCPYLDKDWTSILEQNGCFHVIAQKQFDHKWPMSIESWQGLARSSSGVGSIEEARLAEFHRELTGILEPLETLDVEYMTKLWLAEPRRA